MADEKRFLVDVGMRDLPFPIRVDSRRNPEGQSTVAHISIQARIMQEFEANWIDKFIRIVHQHRDRIGTATLRVNIMDYVEELRASMVKIDFDYPFFVEKTTPVSDRPNLVHYECTYSAKVDPSREKPKVMQKMSIPVITTYPASAPDKPGGLFGQLSVVAVEVQSEENIYPEDLVEIADRHALAPIYSFLTDEDQTHLIEKIHTEKKTSVVMTDEIKKDLARWEEIDWYSVSCSNFGMLHSYSTVIGTEKSAWVPFSGYGSEEI
jgi:GTP cyclohydrolase I